MQNFARILIFISLFATACGDNKDQPAQTPSTSGPANPDTSSGKPVFLPVTDFISGQIADFKNATIAPLRIITKNGKADSTWLKWQDIAPFAEPFLHPVIDSAHMSPYFSEKSFLDQTINAFTFSYEPKTELPDSIDVMSWDLYVDPNNQNIKRVYIVKEIMVDGKKVTQQLTWKSDYWFKITTIKEVNNSTPVIEEEQVFWNFE